MWEVLPEEIHGLSHRIHTIMDFLEDYPDPNTTFVVTEARDDSEIYAHFFDYPKKCRLIFGHGRKTVESAFPLPKEEYQQRSIGIVDCDFDYANPDKQYPECIIATHTHDWETMILSTPAFNLLIEKFGVKEKVAEFQKEQGCSILASVIRAAKPLGFLRLCNYLNTPEGQKGLTFNGIDFLRFIDTKTLNINRENLINCVISNSNCKEIPWCDPIKIKTMLAELESKYSDDWVICQGHDVVAILSIGFEYIFGKKTQVTYGSRTIQAQLKNPSICRREYFINNTFHQKIRRWEMAHVPYQVLVDSLS
jgi:hypothetical protein